ncbi:ABC transporter permease/M1 family aminopeptidase [Salinibacter ruber]|uniref:ABC transporter permease/M1 family aminopeptidase n=1 Tax=Salinibacter ruber TaxID=146919 RepID=UPI00207327A7|nr:M1 family aminopeptidase [Salinibacter ruber]
MPWVDPSKFGSVSPLAYLWPYVLYLIPNLIWLGGLFVAIPAFTRRILPNYIGGVLLLLGYRIAQLLLGESAVQNSVIASLTDPFGVIPSLQLTRYWTAAEQNAQLIPLSGAILQNRLLWLGAGLLSVAALYKAFRFARPSSSAEGDGEAEPAADSLAETSPTSIIHAIDLPSAPLSERWPTRVRQFFSTAWRSFKYVVQDVYFYAILAGTVLFLIVSASEAGRMYGTSVQPVTYQVLSQLSGTSILFFIILITLYAGQLVWRERDANVHQVHDALPLPASLVLAGKGVGLGLVCATLLTVVLIAGIGTQLSFGFTDIDFGLYLKELYGIQLTEYLLYSVLALTVHVVTNRKYLSHFIVVTFFFLAYYGDQVGLEHTLWHFGSDPGMTYSALNGYGHFASGFLWHKALWAAVALLMALGARLAWVRGEDTTVNSRLRDARRRLTPTVKATFGAAGAVALAAGAYIYVSTTVWNVFRSSSEQADHQAEYEKTYERFSAVPQPRIDEVDLDVDLYPKDRDVRLAGTYALYNDRDAPIDTLFVETPPSVEVNELSLQREAETIRRDLSHGVRLLRLPKPLSPGDTATLTFDTWKRNVGFTAGGSQTSVVHNGTFLNSGVLPHLGYDEQRELSDRSMRTERGLDEEPRLRPLSDTTARMRPYLSRDAIWLDYKATVSTGSRQVPLAPGTRDSSWVSGGRRHVRFKTTAPTAGFFSFLSARYDSSQARWTPPDSALNGGKSVGIEIFHQPDHDYNVGRMTEAIKRALSYYTRNFGPYQNQQIRIAEFPRYESFAQSFLGTIPYSEAIGFIARVDPQTDIDYPYYVTAHEVAHQWWGHQVFSGPVWGATMLVETLAQYSALMVMEKTYGQDKMKRFLEYELDRYLNGRAEESREERPLVGVSTDQQYIHYRKGSLAMYALKEYLGEETVNRVLREFLKDHKFQSPPLVTADTLVGRFEKAAPDSLESFIGDLFREITIYDNRATKATYTKTEDGQYRVDLTVEAHKQQADSIGASPTEAPMDLPVEIGVFAKSADVGADEQQVLHKRKRRVTSGEQKISVVVDEKPARAGIDPYGLLIDRNTDDNLTSVEKSENPSEF